MPRPPLPRTVRHWPGVVYYKPQGVPLRVLQETVLGLDELEALRLADMGGLSQEETGERMNVSRATAGRILARARQKVASALVTGQALRIEGGPAMPPPGGGPGMGRGGGRGTGRGRGGGRRWRGGRGS